MKNLTAMMVMVGNLMRKLLLVGDKPSSKNKDVNVAFVGTASHKRIQEWLNIILEEKATIKLVNRVDPAFSQHLVYASLNNYLVIALGEEASLALMQSGVVKHFKLPHPSGRNRKLNNKAYVQDILMKCKKWIEEN
jgi:uracil-DNA glycosylase